MKSPEMDYESLLNRFGLSEFRPGQQSVIEAISAGNDVMCVMPTGGGKSLCYQLPSLAREGTTIVVSPLIALMKDQVDGLQQLGIAARLINSTLTPREQEDVMEEMVQGKLEMVYVAPERLRNGRFLETLRQSNISLLAVDEAHCVSEWGHDFRPDYARLGRVREKYLDGLQTVALTATATPMVRDDVAQLLGLRDAKVFVTGFARTNLRFSVSQSKSDFEKDEQLTQFVEKQEGAGIIYAATRKACEAIGQWLPERTRRSIGVYHGGMEAEHRRIVQEKFMDGKLTAIVATNAFGMGIDKSDIRFVAHYNIPGTLEAYYQEAGRAGRDGLDSDCKLFFSYQDRYIQEFFIENRYPSKQIVQKTYEYLLSRPEDPIELTLDQVREAINAESSESVSTAQTLLAKAGVLRRLDSSQNQMIVRIDSETPTLLDFLPKEAKLRRRVMTAVEKVIGRRRGEDVFVRPKRLMDLASVDRDQLMRTLRELGRLNAFDYVPSFRGRAVHFLQRDIPFEHLEIDFDELARRKAAEYEKLESVIGFARAAGCRQKIILDYFGDPDSKNCGKCDRCDSADGGAPSEFAASMNLTDSDRDALMCGLRVVLSGVTRMHGRFGKTLVAQMLCGSQNKRITQWKLQRLSTYGMLSSMKQTQLTKVIDSLIEHGMVEQREVDQRRPTIEISGFGKSVMHLRSPIPHSFQLDRGLAKSLAAAARHIEATDVTQTQDSGGRSEDRLSDESPSRESTGSESSQAASDETTTGSTGIEITLDDLTSPQAKLERELVEALKRWRRRTSAALGIPAFRVLSNSTIDRLAKTRPETSSELEVVSGIGPATMEQHGYDILELIREHSHQDSLCEELEDSSTTPNALDVPEGPAAHIGPDRTPTHRHENDEAPPENPSSNKENPVFHGEEIRADSGHGDATDRDESNRTSEAEVGQRDAYWTWRLFNEGYTMQEVCEIRRLNRAHIAAHLAAAAERGRAVSPTWQS